MSKPRICLVIATFYPQVGGAERQVLLQGRALRARGYDATIITLRHDRAWPKHDVVEGVPVDRVAGIVLSGRDKLPALLRKLAYLSGVLTLGWVLWWRRWHYDVVHLYRLTLITLPAALVCIVAGKPLIVALRCSDSGYRAHSGGSDTSVVRCLPVSTSVPSASTQDRGHGDLEVLESLGKPLARLTRFLLVRAHAVIVVLTSRMKHDLTRHGFSVADVQIIPNGVDLDRFHYSGPANPTVPRTGVVVYVGRLSYQKGLDVLLQSWRIVREQLSGSQRARLVIVGTGPLRVRLECLAHTLGITDSVEFAGVQSDVAAWLRRSHIGVLPSRWEGMPNALLEAMACGLPCVATRVSGSEDVIQPGVNGLLIEPEDPQALAEALLFLLRDPTLGMQYGRAARATIEERYSLDRVIEIYLELYQKLCSDRRRPVPSAVIQQASTKAGVEGKSYMGAKVREDST